MRTVILSIFLFSSFLLLSQDEILNSITTNSTGLSIKTSKGIYYLNFFHDNILETEFRFDNELTPTVSHAIILPFKTVNLERKKDKNHSYLFQKKGNVEHSISIGVDSLPFQLFFYFNGDLLAKQKANLSNENFFKGANDDQTGRNVTRETGCKAIALAYYNVQN